MPLHLAHYCDKAKYTSSDLYKVRYIAWKWTFKWKRQYKKWTQQIKLSEVQYKYLNKWGDYNESMLQVQYTTYILQINIYITITHCTAISQGKKLN